MCEVARVVWLAVQAIIVSGMLRARPQHPRCAGHAGRGSYGVPAGAAVLPPPLRSYLEAVGGELALEYVMGDQRIQVA